MRVALLGDVHANLPALQAVLADAHNHGAQAVWDLGDCLGYGPFPDQVVRQLRAAEALSVLGNYDAKVLAFEANKDNWRLTKRPEKFLAFAWAHQQLSPESRSHLRSLPTQLRLTVAGQRILLTHGSPAAADEALTPSTPEHRLQQLARDAHADLVACGHSHQPFARRVSGVLFVNPGSVGRPEGGDPRANWALLEIEPRQLSVHLRRIAYDLDQTVQAIRNLGLPEDFARMLLQGRNLKQVQKAHERNTLAN
jgi:putative phosphoesterase